MKGFARTFNIDLALLAVVFALVSIGLICLFSTTVRPGTPILTTGFGRQIVWIVIGFILAGIVSMMPLKIFFQGAYLIYGISIVFLIVVLLLGSGNVQRWIEFGFFRFQPSELAKVATLIILARHFSRDKSARIGWKIILSGIGLALLPVLLILKEPDIGTASVFIGLIAAMVVWTGIQFRILLIALIPVIGLLSGFHLISYIVFIAAYCIGLFVTKTRWWKGISFGVLCAGLGLLSPVIWSQLELYQKHRIAIFLGLKSDPHGAAYQIIQSKVAIGSGAIIGKGFLGGSQTHLRFLPEQHTDFIFSALGEEFGFIGVVIVFSLFLFLFIRIVQLAKNARNAFASFIAFGSVAILAFQFLINVGMTVGLVPVTGLPLPFISYGGSSLLMVMTLIGFNLNISRNLYQY